MFENIPWLNGLLVFLIGMLVVFFGIAIIVLFVTIAGKIFNKAETTTTTTEVETVTEEVVEEAVADTDGIPAEIKVAIIAAVTSYYFTENKSQCDFVVKKIRRI
jgi:Na+-transporting methylmalonyl-CoA/oxaloacetate decarboxylase gamma subunit